MIFPPFYHFCVQNTEWLFGKFFSKPFISVRFLQTEFSFSHKRKVRKLCMFPDFFACLPNPIVKK